jgi:hypothetical protein
MPGDRVQGQKLFHARVIERDHQRRPRRPRDDLGNAPLEVPDLSHSIPPVGQRREG